MRACVCVKGNGHFGKHCLTKTFPLRRDRTLGRQSHVPALFPTGPRFSYNKIASLCAFLHPAVMHCVIFSFARLEFGTLKHFDNEKMFPWFTQARFLQGFGRSVPYTSIHPILCVCALARQRFLCASSTRKKLRVCCI